MKKDFDVIVVGAGNGGLVSAATLAKAGKKVLLLEQHNLPGGFASSFIRGRFEFEPALHELPNFGHDATDTLDSIFEELGINVKWNQVPEAYRLIVNNYEGGKIDITMPFSFPAFIDALDEAVPGNRELIVKYFDLILEMVHGLDCAMGPVSKRGQMLTKHKNLIKVLSYTVDEVQDALKMPDKLRVILNAYWCYLGVETGKLDFFLYALMCYSYIYRGAIVPSMRSHEISSALLDSFHKNGGEAWFNTKVEKIVVENDKAVGVTTKNGVYYSDYVITNVSPTITYGSLIDSVRVPAIERKKSNSRSHGGQGFSVYIGLNKSPEEIGLNEYSYFIYPTGHSNEDVEYMKKLNGPKIIAATCLNKAVPNCSPEGTTIFSITTLFYGDAMKELTAENYFKKKDEVANELINYFEQETGIKIKPYIEEISVASPETYARYTGAYNGCIYGYDTIPTDSVFIRTVQDSFKPKIKNLVFAGAFSVRAHGYGSTYTSGYMAKEKVLSLYEEEEE